MELWDIYDEYGRKTGRTMERGVPKQGDFMLCAHVYLYTPQGEFLLQKRAMTKQSHPGEWDVTGGAVLHGEESIDGAKRETLEEIGIAVSKEELVYVGRTKRKSRFIDIYFVRKKFRLSECILQKEEVEKVCFVDKEELLRIQKQDRKRSADYMRLLEKGVMECVVLA